MHQRIRLRLLISLVSTTTVVALYLLCLFPLHTTSLKKSNNITQTGGSSVATANDLGKIQLTAMVQGDMAMEIELLNMSESKIAMLGRGDLRQVGVSVFKNGVPCKRSEYGNSVLLPIGDHETFGPIKEVGPSESLKWKLNLGKCFDLNGGHYSAIASVNILTLDGNTIGGEEVKSLPVEISIAK